MHCGIRGTFSAASGLGTRQSDPNGMNTWEVACPSGRKDGRGSGDRHLRTIQGISEHSNRMTAVLLLASGPRHGTTEGKAGGPQVLSSNADASAHAAVPSGVLEPQKLS